jgi:hypothetical protein
MDLDLNPNGQPFFAGFADSLSGRFSLIGYCEKILPDLICLS